MTSQMYRAAGTVFPTVLCLLLSGVCPRSTASVASDVATARIPPKLEQPQRLPTQLHALATAAVPCSFPAGVTPQYTGPEGGLTGVAIGCRSSFSVAFSASSSALKADAASIITRSCRNADVTLPRSPPRAVLRDISRPWREYRASLRPPATHPASGWSHPVVTCCMSPTAGPISLFFCPSSSRVLTAFFRKNHPTNERCFFPHRFAPTSCSAAYPASALPSSPSATSFPPAGGLASSGGAAAAAGRPTSSAAPPVPPAAPASPPAPAATRRLRPLSLIVGATPLRSALFPSRAPVTAAALLRTKEQPASVSPPARAVASCVPRSVATSAVRPRLLLLLHRRATRVGCSSPPLSAAAVVAAAPPLQASPARASLERRAPSPASDPLRVTVPAAESGPSAGIPAASGTSSVACSLALPNFLAFTFLLRGVGSAALPLTSPAAFLFPPAVSPLAAAAASCLLHLPAAASAGSSRALFPSFAAAYPLPPSSPPCCSPLPSFLPAAALTLSKPQLAGRPPAEKEGLGVSSPAFAAPSSASFSSSSATAVAARQQQAPLMMKLEAGDGHGGEGLHFFPSLSPPQLPRRASLARGGSGGRGGSRAPLSPAAGGGAAAAGSCGAAGQTGGAFVSPTPPASPFCAGGAAAAGQEEEQQGEAATLIFLHGLGDTAEGWSDIVALASSALPNAAAYLRVILPTADVRPVALTGGMPTNAWADVVGLTRNSPEDEAGFLASKARIDTIIKEEVAAGVSPSRILLGGFSQGGAVAYLVGLQSSYRLAGIIALSTWLPLTRSLKLNAAVSSRPRDSSGSGSRSPYSSSGGHSYGGGVVGGAGSSSSSTNGSSGSSSGTAAAPSEDPTPVLHCHGEQDEVVSFSYGEESAVHVRQLYIQAGVSTAAADRAVQFRRYPGLGHSASNRELADVKDFISQCLLH